MGTICPDCPWYPGKWCHSQVRGSCASCYLAQSLKNSIKYIVISQSNCLNGGGWWKTRWKGNHQGHQQESWGIPNPAGVFGKSLTILSQKSSRGFYKQTGIWCHYSRPCHDPKNHWLPNGWYWLTANWKNSHKKVNEEIQDQLVNIGLVLNLLLLLPR